MPRPKQDYSTARKTEDHKSAKSVYGSTVRPFEYESVEKKDLLSRC